MRYATVCSGIEAPSCAWHPLGWEPVFFSEIDKFPCAVLDQRWPGVPNRGDMLRFAEWRRDAALDLLCGGTPCQSFSVAGLRKGLADPRGNLTLTFLAIAARYRPKWVVWENVPGVLSDRTGAFGAFLGGLAELGYGWAYRVLDAQFAGVPQRRRRVFVVGCAGDWRLAAAVLFERHSLQGHPAPSREARERPAPTISARTKGGGGLGTDFDCDGGLVTFAQNQLGEVRTGDVLNTLNTNSNASGRNTPMICAPETARCIATREGTSQDWETTAMVAHALDSFSAGRCTEDGTGRGTPLVPLGFYVKGDAADNSEVASTLRAMPNQGHSSQAVAFVQNSRSEVRTMPYAGALAADHGVQQQNYVAFTLHGADKTINTATETEIAGSIRTKPPGSIENSSTTAVLHSMQVRRLTPRECERLQGFQDDYTLIEYRGKPAADGPRYKALGNSMAVPVVRWIGERIAMVDCISKEVAA